MKLDKYVNNQSFCFNWFLPGDIDRNQGEASSIKQMVDYMKVNYSINNNKVFVSGLSAGASMTAVMLADYPEIFSAGAINAGCAFKAATDATTAFNAMSGIITKTPQQWGNLVRAENANYTGNYPTLAIFQGSVDITVKPANSTELIKQWTNVQNCDQVADKTYNNFNGNSLIEEQTFNNNTGIPVVKLYTISSMGHAISIDPGTCYQQGGTAGMFSLDENFYSSFWAANFFGILNYPFTIAGTISVSVNQNAVSYSVPYHSGSTYEWTVPSGASIISGQGSNQLTVNWSNQSDKISVIETTSNTCKIGPVELFVSVNVTGIKTIFTNQNDIEIITNPNSNTILVSTKLRWKQCKISVFDYSGRELLNKEFYNNKQILLNNPDISKGIYYLQIILDQACYTKKFIL